MLETLKEAPQHFGMYNDGITFIDTYLTQGDDKNVFAEPAYKQTFNLDLKGFLKWGQVGKSEQTCPRFRNLLTVNKAAMGKKAGGQLSPRESIIQAIKN